MRKAIAVASSDHGHKLKERRDAIVQRLYACRSCDEVNRQQNLPAIWGDNEAKVKRSPYTPQSVHRDEDVDIKNEDEEPDPFRGLFDDEETRILTIKEQIEDPEQSDESLVELLQGLSDMDITFKGLKKPFLEGNGNVCYSLDISLHNCDSLDIWDNVLRYWFQKANSTRSLQYNGIYVFCGFVPWHPKCLIGAATDGCGTNSLLQRKSCWDVITLGICICSGFGGNTIHICASCGIWCYSIFNDWI